MAEKTRLNLVVYDMRTYEAYPIYGLQWNEARELVNWQTETDVDGTVGGGEWREFTKWHRIQIGL